jgi:hypothetical protein
MFRLTYPNTDNEKIGWVRCGQGCTVKRDTQGCNRHPAKANATATQQIVERTAPEPRRIAEKPVIKDEIAEFVDPMEKLRQAINQIGRAA